jgi:hypothetical protein
MAQLRRLYFPSLHHFGALGSQGLARLIGCRHRQWTGASTPQSFRHGPLRPVVVVWVAQAVTAVTAPSIIRSQQARPPSLALLLAFRQLSSYLELYTSFVVTLCHLLPRYFVVHLDEIGEPSSQLPTTARPARHKYSTATYHPRFYPTIIRIFKLA